MSTKKRGSRFTKDVYTDEESAFISCPEYIAEHMAETIAGFGEFHSVVELCSCIGSTCIQMAKHFDQVIGIDNDKKRIEMAEKNAKLYGVAQKTKFIVGDVLDEKLLKSIRADVAILDPVWAAVPMDRSSHVSDINLTQPSLKEMFVLTKKYITSNIVARVPATFTCQILNELGPCKLENIIIDEDNVIFKIAYYFPDVKKCYEEDVIFDK